MARHLPPILALVLGCTLSYWAFDTQRSIDRASADAEFEQAAHEQMAEVQRHVAADLELVQDVGAFLISTGGPTREEFRTFVTQARMRNPSVKALEWVVRIQHGQRAQFERTNHYRLKITEHDARGRVVPAGERAEYFPILYLEPVAAHERTLGFDLGSDAARRAAMQAAGDAGTVRVSGGIALAPATGGGRGVLAFAPLYESGAAYRTVADRRQALTGFALGVLEIGEIMATALDRSGDSAAQPADIALYDESAPPGERLLHGYEQASGVADAHAGVRQSFEFGGRRWTLVARSIASGGHASLSSYLRLVEGLAFTLLLAGYLQFSRNRRLAVERLVDERTAALEQANTRLREEATEREAIAEALRDKEATYRRLIEGSTQGILIHKEWKPLFVNDAYAAMLGYASPDQVLALGTIAGQHAPEESERLLGYQLARMRGGDAPEQYEYEALRKDGSRITLLNTASLVTWQGARAVQRTVMDVTERKRIERMKTEFISTVSHELRTPLTSIMGSLGLMRAGAVGELPEKARSMVEIAYSNSDRLVRLINDILDVERIESGKLAMRVELIEMNALVAEAVAANAGYAQQCDVRLVVADSDVSATVRGDRDRLVQVLTNLISNAAKFSPPDAEVQIAVSCTDERVRVAVSDCGPGIPDEFRARIFRKFAQADSSDTRKVGGTGLGLSICKAIVERLDGTIGFDSEAGHGTTFYFDLPEHRASALPAASVETETQRAHILICEDEPDVATLLALLLKQQGATVDIAPDAAQAKRLLASREYSAMTVDLRLPDQDGLDLIGEIRGAERTCDLPIVVISAEAERVGELAGDAVDIVDWVSKPIDEARLATSVRTALGGSDARPRILHVEDEPDVRQIVAAVIEPIAELVPAATLEQARSLLCEASFDLLMLDLSLPDGAGEKLLAELDALGHESVPVVIFSAREPSSEAAAKVSAALLKSRTSNEQLACKIRGLIANRNPRTKTGARAAA